MIDRDIGGNDTSAPFDSSTVGRKTAVIIDVTEFGDGPFDSSGEPDVLRAKALPFGAAVDELSGALAALGYDIMRPSTREGQLNTAEISPYIREVLEAHHGEEEDVVVVHLMTHGWLHDMVDSLCVLGRDGQRNENADVVELVNYSNKRKNGPFVLFLLDVCFAGQAVEADLRMRRADPDKVWILGASSAAQSAFDARFTTAAADVLRQISCVGGMPEDQPYLLITEFAQRVKAAVDHLAGESSSEKQQVTGSYINAANDVSGLPFFHNPHFRLEDVGKAVVRELPSGSDGFGSQDAAYFVAAATCHRADDGSGSNFTGRERELARLTGWLTNPGGPPIQLVTGRAGSGKSALMGVLVSAAHPDLAGQTSALLAGVGRLPGRVDLFAAVHARHRGVTDFVDKIATQLFGTRDLRTPQGLVNTIQRQKVAPVIVVDALDEAADAMTVVTSLLLPLSRLKKPDGSAGCRLLIASRGDSEVTSLLRSQATDHVNLDQTDLQALKVDIENYAVALLRRSRYGEDEYAVARTQLALGIANRLTRAKGLVWGEFLVTRLYVQHLIDHTEPEIDGAAAEAIGSDVPLSLPQLFDLDPRMQSAQSLARPVLAALALAEGHGMPAQVVAALAAVFSPVTNTRPSDAAVGAVLNSVGVYLRIVPGDDEAAFYQLFHDGLVGHLRDHPFVPGVDRPSVQPVTVCRALLRTVPVRPDGTRDWSATLAYVRRQILNHATGTTLLDDLLSDPDYVLCEAPEPRLALAEVADSATAVPTAGEVAGSATAASAAVAVLDARAAFAQSPFPDTAMMRLAVVAVRGTGPQLAAALAERASRCLRPVLAGDAAPPAPVPARVRLPSRSLLVVGDHTSTVRGYDLADGNAERFRYRHTEPLTLVGLGHHDGCQQLMAGSTAGEVVVVPVVAEPQPRLVLDARAPVRAVTTTELDGRPVVAAATDAQVLRFWDLDTGTEVRTVPVEVRGVEALLPIVLSDGRQGLAVQGRQRLMVVDLDDFHILQYHPLGAGFCHVCTYNGVVTAMRWQSDGRMTAYDLVANRQIAEIAGPAGSVTSATVVAGVNDHLVTAAGKELTWWDLGTGAAGPLATAATTVVGLTSCVLDGRSTIVCATGAAVGLWDFTTCGLENTFRVTSPVRCFAHAAPPVAPSSASPAAVAAATGTDGLVVTTWSGGPSVRVHRVPGPAAPLDLPVAGPDIALSVVAKDGDVVVVAEGDNGERRIWHPVTGEVLAELGPGANRPAGPGEDWLLMRDRLVFVRGRPDGVLELASTTGVVDEIQAHEGPIAAVAVWRQDTETFAATCSADLVRLWDLSGPTAVEALTFPAPIRAVRAVDGRYLVVRTDSEVVAFEFTHSRGGECR